VINVENLKDSEEVQEVKRFFDEYNSMAGRSQNFFALGNGFLDRDRIDARWLARPMKNHPKMLVRNRYGLSIYQT
jgi:hypothetical protein